MEEKELLKTKYNLDEEDARRVATLAYELRKMKHDDLLTAFISTRDIEQYAQLRSAGISPELAIKISIVQKGGSSFEQESITKKAEATMKLPKPEIDMQFDYIKLYKDLLIEHKTVLEKVEVLEEETMAILQGKKMKKQPKKSTSEMVWEVGTWIDYRGDKFEICVLNADGSVVVRKEGDPSTNYVTLQEYRVREVKAVCTLIDDPTVKGTAVLSMSA